VVEEKNKHIICPFLECNYKKERERNINIFFFSKDVRISEAYYTLKENMTLELKRKRACLITNARYKLVEFRERHAKYRGSNRCDD